MENKSFTHPYIPNSVPSVQKEMMDAVGIKDLDDMYCEIPEHLRYRERLNIPEPIRSEYELKKHVEKILDKNTTCEEFTSFLGGGCWQHYVPAVVDEVANRAEFVTAYAAGTYSDFGKWQARYEFYSMMGELTGADIIGEPVYDWGTAAGMAIRMASRITGRNEVIVPANMSPDRLSIIRTFCQPEIMDNSIKVRKVGYNGETGCIDMDQLKKMISDKTAAVYFEMPGYLGVLEENAEEICTIAGNCGAVNIVGVDPISLGIVAPPMSYGADIVVGELQPLGIHMLCGGGQAGILAYKDDEVYAAECPLECYTIAPTTEEGVYGYTEIYAEKTSYGSRDKGKDFTGTASGLWTIAACVYMALMGPEGMTEVGETILANSNYARKLIGQIDGVKVPFGATFKEFVVDFNGTGKTVAEINKALEAKKIFGGIDLSKDFPELGQSALFCVTEIHTLEDINNLVQALKEVC